MSWGAPDSFVSKSVTKSIRNTTENELEAPELFISKSVTGVIYMLQIESPAGEP